MKNAYFAFILILILCAFVCLSFKKNRSLLIIGCARSGTAYIANVLQESAFQIGHERMGKDGVSSWYLAAQPKNRKRRVNLAKFHFAHIFHQVRHPLHVISSVYSTEDLHSWSYIMAHLPEIRMEDSHLVKCAKYWYFWNLKAEKFAEWTYRVEDVDSVWDEFGNRLGKRISKAGFEKVSKHFNTRGDHRMFTWEDLQRELDPDLYGKILDMALKYGYSIPQNAI